MSLHQPFFASPILPPSTVCYLIVGGGGGGAYNSSFGGGGAAGIAPSSSKNITVGTCYSIVIGGGGSIGGAGNSSSAFCVTATAGNGGSGSTGGSNACRTGGAGVASATTTTYYGCYPISLTVSAGGGGASTNCYGGYGDGHFNVGMPGSGSFGGNGGAAKTALGKTVSQGGKGGAIVNSYSFPPCWPYPPAAYGGGGGLSCGVDGGTNTGSGGGGESCCQGSYRSPGNGGSGVVVIRYPSNKAAAKSTTGSPTVTVACGYRTYVFNGTGSIKW